MKHYLIGLDNGGTSVKAALFDEDGKQICISSRKLQTIHPQSTIMERDLKELWQKNLDCLKELVEKSNVDPKHITAMSFSGHGKGLYLLDKEGNDLGNGILSMDQRAKHIVEQWNEKGISHKVFKHTFQKVVSAQPVALLRWLKEQQPAVYERIGSVLSVKDYIRYRFSGNIYGEISDFSGSNLIDFETTEYSDELLTLFGIEDIAHALPPLKKSTDICGSLSYEAAMYTGLKAGMPMSAGMFDVDACCIGCGMRQLDQLAMIGGTWSINVYLMEHCVHDERALYQSIYALPSYYLMEESSPTSCGNLEWIMEELLAIQDYDTCNKLVSSITPADNSMLFLPFLYGSNEGDLQACFLHMSSSQTRAHILRSVYEGIAFAHKTHLERLLTFRKKPSSIRIAGGIVKSSVWLHIFADILQIPLEVVDNEELGAQGAAICAGVGAGIYPDYEQAIQRHVHIKEIIVPDSNLKDVYEAKYRSYRKAIDALSKKEVKLCMKN